IRVTAARQPPLNTLKESLVDVAKPRRSLNARDQRQKGYPSTVRTNAFSLQLENSSTTSSRLVTMNLLQNERSGRIRDGLDQNLVTVVVITVPSLLASRVGSALRVDDLIVLGPRRENSCLRIRTQYAPNLIADVNDVVA